MTDRIEFPLPADGIQRTLRDGTPVLLRPIRKGDAASFAAAFEKLSDVSRYRRFFTAMPKLPDGWAEMLTDVDHHKHRAWVVIDPAAEPLVDGDEGQGIAVGRMIVDDDDPTTAEAAITVTDAYQHQGIGRMLLDAIVSSAALNDIAHIRAVTLPENRGMIGLLRDLDAALDRSESDRDGVTYEIAVPPLGEADITEGALYEILRYAAEHT